MRDSPPPSRSGAWSSRVRTSPGTRSAIMIHGPPRSPTSIAARASWPSCTGRAATGSFTVPSCASMAWSGGTKPKDADRPGAPRPCASSRVGRVARMVGADARRSDALAELGVSLLRRSHDVPDAVYAAARHHRLQEVRGALDAGHARPAVDESRSRRAGVVARRAARPEGDAGAHPVCVWAADMRRSSVAAVVADGVARAGVPRVFASPGALVAIGDAAIARGLAVVETAGATAAGVMAAITAELVDAPGVALVSFAGGLAPVLDGAAHATRDRAAVIVISEGAADSRLHEPVVKATVVADPASAGHWIAHAAQLCMADPRGAVHLVVPAGVAEAPALPVVTACRRAPVPAPAADALDALADSIARAARPVLVAGLETGPDDAKWLRALAESVPAPVLTTPKGKGALPDPHPLVLGLLAAEHPRSEERRVGKECRSRWSPYH